MVFVYIRIYFAARARARRAQENKIKRKQSQTKEQKEKEQQLEMQEQFKRKQAQEKHQEQMEMVEKKVTKSSSIEKEQSQPLLTNNGSASVGQPNDPLFVSVSESRVSLIDIKTTEHSIDIRRHSLTAGDELKGLRLTPGLTAGMPSVSMDRLSIDGRNKKNKEVIHQPDGHEMAHSTAPSSLMAINESSSAGDEENQPSGSSGIGGCGVEETPIHHPQDTTVVLRPSSMKNGCELNRTSSGARHSVTFECQTSDNAVTYTMVRCSVLNDNECPLSKEVAAHDSSVVNETTVATTTLTPNAGAVTALAAINTAAAASELTSSASSVSRRASLLFPTRRKFEKLARRFGAGCAPAPFPNCEAGQTATLQPPKGRATSTNRMLKPETEWSTSSYPSSPVLCPKGDHLEETSPSTVSDVMTVVHVTNPLPPTSSSLPQNSTSVPPAIVNNCTARSTNNSSLVHKNSSRSGDHDLTENEMASDGGLDPSSSDSGTMARCTVVRPLKIRFCRPSSSGSVNKKSSKAKRQVHTVGSSFIISFLFFFHFTSIISVFVFWRPACSHRCYYTCTNLFSHSIRFKKVHK